MKPFNPEERYFIFYRPYYMRKHLSLVGRKTLKEAIRYTEEVISIPDWAAMKTEVYIIDIRDGSVVYTKEATNGE